MEENEASSDLADQLLVALNHLHDPAYQPSGTLLSIITGARGSADTFRAAIVQAIESLKPSIDLPAHSPSRRVYDLLFLRYVEGQTQKATAERLGITSRHLRRQQQPFG